LNVKLLVMVTVHVIVSPPTEPVLLHWSTVPPVTPAAMTGAARRVLSLQALVVAGAEDEPRVAAVWPLE
jgi:hypothetical protein